MINLVENFRKEQNFTKTFVFLWAQRDKTRIIIKLGHIGGSGGDKQPEARMILIILSKKSIVNLQNLRNFPRFDRLFRIFSKMKIQIIFISIGVLEANKNYTYKRGGLTQYRNITYVTSRESIVATMLHCAQMTYVIFPYYVSGSGAYTRKAREIFNLKEIVSHVFMNFNNILI